MDGVKVYQYRTILGILETIDSSGLARVDDFIYQTVQDLIGYVGDLSGEYFDDLD